MSGLTAINCLNMSMKPPIFKIYQARDLTQKEEGLLRTIATGLKRTLNESVASEKSDWIVVGSSPFRRLSIYTAEAARDLSLTSAI